jgi:hypothetical protein
VDPTVEDLWGGSYFGHIDNKRLIFNKQYNISLHPTPLFVASEQPLLQILVWEYDGFQGKIDANINYSGKTASGY